eukprot:7954465-Alexandrium_andersonii.AAC.1
MADMQAGAMPASMSAEARWRLEAMLSMVAGGTPFRRRASNTPAADADDRTRGRNTARNAPAMSTNSTAQL